MAHLWETCDTLRAQHASWTLEKAVTGQAYLGVTLSHFSLKSIAKTKRRQNSPVVPLVSSRLGGMNHLVIRSSPLEAYFTVLLSLCQTSWTRKRWTLRGLPSDRKGLKKYLETVKAAASFASVRDDVNTTHAQHVYVHFYTWRNRSHRGIAPVHLPSSVPNFGPKILNQEKLSTPKRRLWIQNDEDETALNHQIGVHLLNLCWFLTDYGTARSAPSSLTVTLPLFKATSILQQVIWMQPGRHTWTSQS